MIYLLVAEEYPGVAEWPLASFRVTDLERTVDELRSRGVTTSHDAPQDTDERGIADLGGPWIRDPDGQVLSIIESTG